MKKTEKYVKKTKVDLFLNKTVEILAGLFAAQLILNSFIFCIYLFNGAIWEINASTFFYYWGIGGFIASINFISLFWAVVIATFIASYKEDNKLLIINLEEWKNIDNNLIKQAFRDGKKIEISFIKTVSNVNE